MQSAECKVQSVESSAKCKACSVKVAKDADAADNGIMPVLLLTVSSGGVGPQLRSFLRQRARAGLNRMQVGCTSKPTY